MIRFFNKKTKKTSKFSTRYTVQKMIFFKRCISCIVSWFLMRKNIYQNRMENSNFLIFFWKNVYMIWFWVFFLSVFFTKSWKNLWKTTSNQNVYMVGMFQKTIFVCNMLILNFFKQYFCENFLFHDIIFRP